MIRPWLWPVLFAVATVVAVANDEHLDAAWLAAACGVAILLAIRERAVVKDEA